VGKKVNNASSFLLPLCPFLLALPTTDAYEYCDADKKKKLARLVKTKRLIIKIVGVAFSPKANCCFGDGGTIKFHPTIQE
jgi:hypothetical protein